MGYLIFQLSIAWLASESGLGRRQLLPKIALRDRGISRPSDKVRISEGMWISDSECSTFAARKSNSVARSLVGEV